MTTIQEERTDSDGRKAKHQSKLQAYAVEEMKRDGLLVDFEVTPDPRRIIRLPGTVHGKHMTVCKIISEDDLLDWENQEDCVMFMGYYVT